MKTQTEQTKPKSPRRPAAAPTELSDKDVEYVTGGFLNPNMIVVPDLKVPMIS